jgi:hypothetical protein
LNDGELKAILNKIPTNEKFRGKVEQFNSKMNRKNKDEYSNFSDNIQTLICTVDVLKDNLDDEVVKKILEIQEPWKKRFFENLYNLLSIVHCGLQELHFGTLLIPFKREAEEKFEEFCYIVEKISKTHTLDECSVLAKLAKKGDHSLLERMMEKLKKIKLKYLESEIEKAISFEMASKLKKEGKQVFKHIREMTAK